MLKGSAKRRLLARACLAAFAALWPAGIAAAQQASPFQPERYDEDWSKVDPDAAPFGAQWKDMPVESGVTLSIGGDARWRFANLSAPKLGIHGEESDSYILQRFLLHADLRLGNAARIFLQLGDHEAIGRNIIGTTDENKLDLQQAFVDLNHDFGGAQATLRIGRQGLVLGSPRWMGARDSGNIRERQDVALLIVKAGDWRIDAFDGYPTHDAEGVFDDSPDRTQDLYGLQIQRDFGGVTGNIYAIQLNRDAASIAGHTAFDDRLSLGTRLFGKTGAYDFDGELMIQQGWFGDEAISALGLSVDVGRTFADAAWKPRFGVRYTYGSGDKDLADNRQDTFAPPFPQGSWFGQNGLSSFSNATEAAITVGLSPIDAVSTTIKLADVKRATTADYLYTSSTAIAGTNGGHSSAVGILATGSTAWRVNANATLSLYVSYLDVSDEVKALGGRDVAYTHAGVTLRF